jgi:capsular exopolysaccharide synthesis family protein
LGLLWFFQLKHQAFLLRSYYMTAAAAAPSGVAYVETAAGLDFARVWSSILAIAGENSPKSILFVSPGPQQGASTLACGSALTAAQATPELRLGLLDCNFRAPAMEKLLRVPASPGAVDALAGTTDPGELGYSLGVHANLQVIPAGQVNADPLALFRRDATLGLVKALTSRFDILLVDTAPVNYYPEAQILAPMVDAVVMVIDVGRIPREAVAKAKQIIQATGANLLGTVLNRRRHPVPGILYSRV